MEKFSSIIRKAKEHNRSKAVSHFGLKLILSNKIGNDPGCACGYFGNVL